MNKKGFTLIELLIVVVIIGILAAIAIPRFSSTRERAFQSAVVSDLRNLQTVQEQYYADPSNPTQYTYGALATLQGDGLFSASNQVVIGLTLENSDQGYVATGSHNAIPGSCQVIVGNATTEPAEGTSVGQIVCDWDPEPAA